MSQKPNLNQADIELLNKLLDRRFEEQGGKIEKRLEEHTEGIKIYVRQAIQEETPKIVEEKIKNIPTRDEYLSGQDKIMGELKIVREEQSAHMAIHDRIEKRLQRVEKKISSQTSNLQGLKCLHKQGLFDRL